MYYFCNVNNKETTYTCPICGSAATSHFAKCKDYAVSGETYELQRCENCGVIYTIDTPLDEDRNTYSKLQQELDRADKPRRIFDRIYYNMRFVTIRRRIRLIEELTRLKKGRLLNYGAKSGYFSSRMANRGWNVTSLEEHFEHRIFSLEMFHHRMLEISEIDNLRPESFDVITLWHIFEHHSNPGQLIDKLHSLLKPNGILLIACPNSDSFDAAHYGPYWAAWDVPRHLWHFNPASLMTFCRKHNFVMMYHKRIPYDVFYISLLSERYKSRHFKVLKGLLTGFYYWMKTNRHRGGSSSIVYGFRKISDRQ